MPKSVPSLPSEPSSTAPVTASSGSAVTGGVRGRRALLTGGATTVLGVLGIAAAGPASAKAGDVMRVGRSNAAGSATTTLTTSASNGLYVRNTVGNAVYGETTASRTFGLRGSNTSTSAYDGGGVIGQSTKNHGVKGTTKSSTASGVWAVNQAAGKGSESGCAVLAQGRYNPGVIAETLLATDRPALWGIGGDGQFAGLALMASGTSLLDGYAKMLRPTAAVLNASGVLEYAPMPSGEIEYHTLSMKIVLGIDGSANVDLRTLSDGTATGTYSGFVRTVFMKTLRVQLTPVGMAMPLLFVTNLPATDTTSTFRISGDAAYAGKTVHVLLTAERRPLTLAAASASASAPSLLSARAGDPVEARGAVSARGRVGRTA